MSIALTALSELLIIILKFLYMHLKIEKYRPEYGSTLNGVCEAIYNIHVNQVKCVAHFSEINFHSVLHFNCSNVDRVRSYA